MSPLPNERRMVMSGKWTLIENLTGGVISKPGDPAPKPPKSEKKPNNWYAR
jgi:hypothetical protein